MEEVPEGIRDRFKMGYGTTSHVTHDLTVIRARAVAPMKTTSHVTHDLTVIRARAVAL